MCVGGIGHDVDAGLANAVSTAELTGQHRPNRPRTGRVLVRLPPTLPTYEGPSAALMGRAHQFPVHLQNRSSRPIVIFNAPDCHRVPTTARALGIDRRRRSATAGAGAAAGRLAPLPNERIAGVTLRCESPASRRMRRHVVTCAARAHKNEC